MWRQTFEWDFRQTFGKLWYTMTKDLDWCMISVINRMHPFAKVNSSMKGSSGTKSYETLTYWIWSSLKKKMDMIQQKHCLQKIKWYECDTLENHLQLHVAREIRGLLEMCWLNLPCRFGWLKIGNIFFYMKVLSSLEGFRFTWGGWEKHIPQMVVQ